MSRNTLPGPTVSLMTLTGWFIRNSSPVSLNQQRCFPATTFFVGAPDRSVCPTQKRFPLSSPRLSLPMTFVPPLTTSPRWVSCSYNVRILSSPKNAFSTAFSAQIAFLSILVRPAGSFASGSRNTSMTFSLLTCTLKSKDVCGAGKASEVKYVHVVWLTYNLVCTVIASYNNKPRSEKGNNATF